MPIWHAVSISPALPPAPAPKPTGVTRDAVDKVLEKVLTEKNHIHYHPMNIIAEHDLRSLTEGLRQYLQDFSEIRRLDLQNVLKDRPQSVLKRMSAIDVLEELASSDKITAEDREFALERLRDVVVAKLPEKESEDVQRIVLAEKYDALVAITRTNREFGLNLYQSIDKKLQNPLAPALIGGLIDGGLTRSEANELVKGLQQE